MLTEEQLTRIAKLPAWAQDLALRLNRKTQEQAEQIQDLISAGPADSNATLDPNAEVPVRLKRNPTIKYSLNGGGYIETRFNGDTLTVHGNGPHYADEFVVRPVVSNSVLINFAPDQPRG